MAANNADAVLVIVVNDSYLVRTVCHSNNSALMSWKELGEFPPLFSQRELVCGSNAEHRML